MQLGTVAEHAHARAVHAANDGAAGPGAKVAAGDAGLAAQRLAQRGLTAAHQFIAFEHCHGRGHVARAQLQAAGRHGNGRQAGFDGSGRRGSLGLGQRGAPCSQQSNGQGHGAQGKAVGGQCGMNHEEPWKSEKSDANRAAAAARGAQRPTRAQIRMPCDDEEKSTLALVNQALTAIKSGVISALPTCPWHSTGFGVGQRTHRAHQGPSTRPQKR